MKTYYEKIKTNDPNCNLAGSNSAVEVERNMMKEGKEYDAKMKKEIHRDHIQEMFAGGNFKKEPIQSEFQQNFRKC